MRGVGPTAAHPFGYDHLGRDLLSRVIFGTRVALLVGLIATGISVTIGVVMGAVAGYFGNRSDTLISRVIDTLMAFPIIALLLVLASVLGPSLNTTIIVIGVTGWARFARVVRADVMSLKATDFVTAARAVGVTRLAHHLAASAAQRDGAGNRFGNPGYRGHYYSGVGALIPGPGHPPAGPILGADIG